MQRNKIRIFVDAHVFDDSFQGTTTYLKGLYTAMVEEPDFEFTLGSHDIEKLREIFPDPRFRFIRIKSGSKYLRLAFEIPKVLKQNQFDFAHFQYITPLFKPCKYINTIHDLLFLDFPEYFPPSYRWSKQLLFRRSSEKSDLICTVSEYSRSALTRHFKVNPAKISLTPNAVSEYTGGFSDVKKKYGLEKYILFVSRLEPRKNHALTLRAFSELKLNEQGYKLVFIGRMKDVKTDDYFQCYNNLAPAVKSAILNLEQLSYSKLYSFYREADLFLYPSAAEGFGIPPLEAAMLNCKVLCSNQTAMRDFDFFGEQLFDPADLMELKSKIISTLQNDDYPFQKIRSAVMARYNWKKIAGDFAQKIRSMNQQRS